MFWPPSHFDPYAQDRIQQSTHSLRSPYHENLDSGSSQSDGDQVPLNHGRPYYHRTISQHNQFTPAPDYFSPQPLSMNHHDRFPTKSLSSSSQFEHSYPRSVLIAFPWIQWLKVEAEATPTTFLEDIKADLYINPFTCRGVRRVLRSGKDAFELSVPF